MPIGDLRAGDEAAVLVKVEGSAVETRAAGLLITRAYVSDGTDAIPVVWYNQPWLKRQLQPGRELLLYGRVEFRRGTLQMTCPAIERERAIVPVYRPVAGVPPKAFRDAMRAVLKINDGQWPDELPQTLRERFTLCERNFAMRNAHFPLNREALAGRASQARVRGASSLSGRAVASARRRGGGRKARVSGRRS